MQNSAEADERYLSEENLVTYFSSRVEGLISERLLLHNQLRFIGSIATPNENMPF